MKLRKISTKQGQAMIISAVFFLFLSALLVVGSSGPILEQVNTTDDLTVSKSAYYTSEAGTEDAIYRIKNGLAISGTEVLSVGNATATTTISDTTGGKTIISYGADRNLNRVSSSTLSSGLGTAFYYGMQVGQGGVSFNNSSSVTGNLYSNGPITGTGNNVINGDVVSTGAGGLIDGLDVTGTARAHTVGNSNVDGDAYYGCATLPATCFSNTTVGGTKYPNSADPATVDEAITDDDITALEDAAAAGGTHTTPCSYNITGNVTLGPRKINCDLNISNNAVVTLTGPVWVVGTVNISNNAQIRVSSTLGPQSIAIIADDPNDRLNDSRIYISNSAVFAGSGNANSFVVLISMNRSAEVGGGNYAMIGSNSITGAVVLYAPHGKVALSNSVQIKEITAYTIEVNNSANIQYQTGLANLLFNTGPSGGYVIETWKESQ